MVELFSVPMFFVLFRETLEAAVIVSILITFIERMELPSLTVAKTTHIKQRFKRQVWLGTAAGLGVSLALAAVVVTVFYTQGRNIWEGAELLWESVFGFIASGFITVTAISMLKSHELTEKLERKIGKHIEAAKLELPQSDSFGDNGESSRTVLSQNAPSETTSDSEVDGETENLVSAEFGSLGKNVGYVFFWIPFLTVLREGVEALLFITGVAISTPATAIPLAAVTGILLGLGCGAFVHYGGSKLTLHYFYVVSSYFLFIIAAGLFSRSEGLFEDHLWNLNVQVDPDAADAVFFDPRVNIWMLPCCKKNQGLWTLMYAIFGWRDVATIGTIVSYIAFWLVLSVGLVLLRLRIQKKQVRL